MIQRIYRKVYDGFTNFRLARISESIEFNPEGNFYLFSDPRGGSTWMAQALLKIEKTAIINEPLHLSYIDHFKNIGFGWRQFIPENADWVEAKKQMNQVLRGKVLNTDLINLSQIKDYSRAEKLVVKFCRGNALLPWFVSQYNLKFKPILLLRHPIAVAASQIKQGGWNYNFKSFEIPENPFNEIYLEHADFLRSVRTLEESLVAHWCIINSIPLTSSLQDRWIVVFYEHLFLQPANEMNRIFENWGMTPSSRVIDQMLRTSDSANHTIDFNNKSTQLNRWKNFFSEDRLKRMLEIMSYFKIDVYNQSPLPNSRE